jgi:DNA-binding CsgD family transcriptional regulator
VHAMAEVLTSEGFRRSGAGTPFNTAHMALAVLAIGQGDYREALAPARYEFDVDPISHGHQAIPEVIEAAVRSGEDGIAATALARLAERATTAATPWALGVLARCRALMGAGPVEEQYSEAIAQLEQCDMAVDLARAHLLFGEWLRDQQRRADAREHLATAVDMFSRFGASAFERRARAGLAAAGGGAPTKRPPGTRRALTPQEAQIADLAATGATNSEIAAQVFLSVATVDYHLRKVFRELGIRSRRQLTEGLRSVGASNEA